jgi:hypothetical protein
MRTYYRGPDAVITSTVFTSRTAAQPYAIRDLRTVRIQHTEPTQPSVGHVVLGLLVIALTGWPLWQASSLYALTLAALMLPALALLAVIVARDVPGHRDDPVPDVGSAGLQPGHQGPAAGHRGRPPARGARRRPGHRLNAHGQLPVTPHISMK